MNVFQNPDVAGRYDDYYQTGFGKKIDQTEKKMFDKLLEEIEKDEMLELGCGTGHWTSYFVEKGFDVIATDVSEPMLNLAKSKDIHAVFEHADSANLPFPNESFNVVASVTMLEFTTNPEKVIDEIYRILKTDGWLLLGCLNKKSVIGLNKENDEVFKNGRFFTLDEIKQLLGKFKIQRIETGVYLKPDFTITDDWTNEEPVFMGILAQKNKL